MRCYLTLLHHVRQLVGQQVPASRFTRLEHLIGENDILSNRVGGGVNGTRRVSRTLIGVNTNSAEVMTKARFHKRPCRRVEWLPWRVEYFVHDRWNLVCAFTAQCSSLQRVVLLFASGALTAAASVLSAGALPLQQTGSSR